MTVYSRGVNAFRNLLASKADDANSSVDRLLKSGN